MTVFTHVFCDRRIYSRLLLQGNKCVFERFRNNVYLVVCQEYYVIVGANFRERIMLFTSRVISKEPLLYTNGVEYNVSLVSETSENKQINIHLASKCQCNRTFVDSLVVIRIIIVSRYTITVGILEYLPTYTINYGIGCGGSYRVVEIKYQFSNKYGLSPIF